MNATVADAPIDLRAKEIYKRLKAMMPKPRCELDFGSPWQLLVATILSAQSTDKGVNKVTPQLFARWPTPEALAKAPRLEVEALIRPTGFFRNKAKAICGAAEMIVTEYRGQVPSDMETLTRLPGVARKTANVVLGTAMGVAAGMAVDTHTRRVANRLGLTSHQDPVKIEADLCALFPQSDWTAIGHRFVLHGRYVCTAKQPKCAVCPLNELCPSAATPPEGTWRHRATTASKLIPH